MRRTIRLERSIDFLRARPTTTLSSPFLCSACSIRTSSFSTTSRVPERTKAPYTDTIRRKIWGTDSPPGQKDPYGAATKLDETEAETQVQSTTAVQADTHDYVPASDWEGLESVGGFGNWWRDHWDPNHRFESFMPNSRIEDPNQLTAALHQGLVEVFALRQAGHSINDIANTGLDLTSRIQITPSLSGAELQFSDAAEKEQMIQSLLPTEEAPTQSEQDVTADRSEEDPLHPADETAVKSDPTESEEDVAADRSEVDPLKPELHPKDYQNQVASWDPSWLQVSLVDLEIKFAVLKRTMQLTGVRIPDAAINNISTAQELLSHLITPPKPRKVIEALSQNAELVNLPNVKILSRRVTPIDKEESVGRWKVIRKELEDRGLPVTGH